MDNDEINKYIHETILGKCWHDWDVVGLPPRCLECGKTQSGHALAEDSRPDYCSDDSPRRLLNEVVAKIIEQRGKWFGLHVWDSFKTTNEGSQFSYSYIVGRVLLLPAEQIARACVKAHQELNDDKR